MRAVAALAVLAGIALSGSALANPWVGPDIASLRYGVYCSEPPTELQDAPGTASGVINIVPGIPEFRYVQTLVPAQIGIGFGVLVQARDGASPGAVTVTISHPPYPDSGIEVEQWIATITDEREYLIGFSFEVAQELVPGPWVFRADDGDTALFEITFDVVPASLVPDIASACSGAFLS